MKASAKAHPIQGLIKYHGKIHEQLRLPSHNSISVNVAPLATHTTVEFNDEAKKDTLTIDGKTAQESAVARASRVLDLLREQAGTRLKTRVASTNNFPADVGLGSSASGFAALTKAAASALGLDIPLGELSAIARVGSGSASRSMVGGFAEWKLATTHRESYSYRLDSDAVPLKMVVALAKQTKDMPTTESQRETELSPLYSARLGQIPEMLMRMKIAIENSDISEIGRLAEMDTLNMHAVTMTGPSRLILWRPETVAVMRRVRELRRDGIECYFSVDTGAAVFVNTSPDHVSDVTAGLKDIADLEGVLECDVGGEATTVSEHLF
jgi:phosphomevalonate decarboxylase